MKQQKFSITGMSCSACSAAVQKSVEKLDGITKCEVNLLTNSMDTEYDETKLNNKKIISAVKKAGYGAEIFTFNEEKYNKDKNSVKKRLILSIVFLIPLMFVSMSHMFGVHISFLENMTVFGICQLIFLIPILVINKKYFIGGFKSLFKLHPNMDALIALGAGVSVAYSLYIFIKTFNMTVAQAGAINMHYYFESAGMILTFITIGKYLESKSKSKTSSAISKLIKLTPKTAIIEVNGEEKEVNTDTIKSGDIVICKNGLSIPVDGEIVSGSCSVDESAITGESVPVDKTIGAEVTGGTVISSGYIKIKATNTGDNTVLSKIIKLVENATSSKAPIARIADKVAGVFVPSVIAIALITTIIWIIAGADIGKSISFGIAVLVISCPCALGLATPTAIMVGTGKAAQYGILIKSATALETSNSINTVIMDKTGTITKGAPKVTDVISYSDKLLEIAYALENNSEHPLARSVVEYAKENGVKLLKAENFNSNTGFGVSAIINSKKYYSGNYAFIESLGIKFDNNSILELYSKGKTPLLFSDEEKVIGIIAVADTIKDTSKKAVENLRAIGVNSVMLTGDNKQTAKAIQKSAGIKTAYAQVLPHQKEQIVRKYKKQGTTAMVGDGINDSPALVTADVGIAIGAGTDIAIDSADIVLMKSDLLDVVTLIKLSKAVMKNIKENLFWAFIYNIICIPLAAGAFYNLLGWQLEPMFGTIAMSLSSVCVVSNALRLKRFKPQFIKSDSRELKEYETIIPNENEIELKTVKIQGMMCEHCVARVKKALEAVCSNDVTVSLNDNSARVPATIDDTTINEAVTNAGYKVISIE
ncbi:MAG: heavy metal translocating P-type ATPase [Ruminococcus sp.]|nr:heavy metal translocating P-type ATPase [Ruminococcus sp.]